MTVDELNRRFGIPGAAGFEPGRGGLTRLAVIAPGGEAHVYLLGAHVTHWQPARGEPVLWVSRNSAFEVGRPIRGGVPVCHPWFAERPGDPGAPLHGPARLVEWSVASVERGPGGDVTAALTTAFGPGAGGREGDFELTCTVTVGSTLALALRTRNLGNEPLTVTEALHSYFRVADVRGVSVTGLEGCTYFGKVTGGPNQVQGDEPITFRGETDSVYLNTPADCVLHDPRMGRRIRVTKSGSMSTVVWNPWVDKARRMPDFGDDEWPEMLCIETANALDDAVTVPPGESHTLAARIRVEATGSPAR